MRRTALALAVAVALGLSACDGQPEPTRIVLATVPQPSLPDDSREASIALEIGTFGEATLRTAPDFRCKPDSPVYASLVESEPAWRPTQIASTMPDEGTFIRGTVRRCEQHRVHATYGLEELFRGMPEKSDTASKKETAARVREAIRKGTLRIALNVKRDGTFDRQFELMPP